MQSVVVAERGCMQSVVVVAVVVVVVVVAERGCMQSVVVAERGCCRAWLYAERGCRSGASVTYLWLPIGRLGDLFVLAFFEVQFF